MSNDSTIESEINMATRNPFSVNINRTTTLDGQGHIESLRNIQQPSPLTPCYLHPMMQTVTHFPLKSIGHSAPISASQMAEINNNQQDGIVFTQQKDQPEAAKVNIRDGLLRLQFNSILSSLDKGTTEWSTVHQLQVMYDSVTADMKTQQMKMMYPPLGNNLADTNLFNTQLHEKLITKVENSLKKFQSNRKYTFTGHEENIQPAKITRGSYMEDLIQKCAAKGCLTTKS